MVIHLLIVVCYCYGNEEEFWRQQLYPFSYTITSANRHAADSFMALNTLTNFDSCLNLILMETTGIFIFSLNSFYNVFIASLWNNRPKNIIYIAVMNSCSVVVREKRVLDRHKRALDRQTEHLFRVQLLSNATARYKREIQKNDIDRFGPV